MLASTAAAAALVAGCSAPTPIWPGMSGGPGGNGIPVDDRIIGNGTEPLDGADIRLVTFDACDQFLSHVKSEALKRVGPWGLGGLGRLEEEGATFAQGADGGEAAAKAPVQGVDYSGTNVQEVGVDEPDTAKTDGRTLFTVAGQRERRIEIVDLTGDDPVAIGSIPLAKHSWEADMLLADGRLLVLDRLEHPYDGRAQEESSSGEKSGVIDAYEPSSRLRLFDVTNPSDPRLVSHLRVEGQWQTARLIDGVVRVVVNSSPLAITPSYPKSDRLSDRIASTRRNKAAIEESTASDWLPKYLVSGPEGEQTGQLVSCDRIHEPPEFSGFGTTSVLTLDMSGDLTLTPSTSVGVLTHSSTVYASTDRLYVSTTRWFEAEPLRSRPGRETDERIDTRLHAFDITDPAGTGYLGSGSVTGHLLGQWALSEHDGVLRVASTEVPPWAPFGEEDREGPQSESYVTTFGESDGQLVELGRVGGLGKGETIHAVRFIGDIGYVVTFRQIDPLYTVDLSDPASPRVLGELKIPGYSAYLHPVGDGLLLGVGQDADSEGMVKGMQLSLFDVSDLANPRRLHTAGIADSYSEVEWSHLGFLHWPATGLTAVPYMKYEQASSDAGVVGYTVDAEDGIEEIGRVNHPAPDDIPKEEAGWFSQIHRSIVVGDTLYTISDFGVMGSDLDTLTETGWLAF